MKNAFGATVQKKRIALIGGLGVYPMVRLSLSGRRLLSYLALRAQPVTRHTVAANLWPDVLDEVGRANLRRTLWQLPKGWMRTFGEELLLDAESDVPHAQNVAARALSGESLTFDEILLLSNDILPGWAEEWVLPSHESFRLLRVQALEKVCRTLIGQGHHALAVQAGAAAVAAEPLSESAAEALIEAHLAQRNRFQAVQCFRSLATRLKDELGVMPDPLLEKRIGGVANRGSRARP